MLHGLARLGQRPGRTPLAALLSLSLCSVVQADSLLLRHKLATITATDLEQVVRDYGRWLDYKVRERGRVSGTQAASWGAPKTAGRPYVLMSTDAAPDVFIRAVRAPAVRGYQPMRSYGWNAIEIIVDNPDALHQKLRASPFAVIGEPAPLGGYPSIRAFQLRGPSGEVLYLTAETGDRSKSILPAANGPVGRVFIMVLAGPDIEQLLAWYADHFSMARNPVRERPVGVLRRAQGLAPDATVPLTTLRLANAGNLIELDGYGAGTGPRSVISGDLPPGVAMASFAVHSLDDIRLPFIRPPSVQAGAAYGGRRSATARGPAGELVELIEE
jgi:hypothetical protein